MTELLFFFSSATPTKEFCVKWNTFSRLYVCTDFHFIIVKAFEWPLTRHCYEGYKIKYFDWNKVVLSRVSVWWLKTQLFASFYIWLEYIFEASYCTLVTSSAKNQVSTNQNSRNRWCHIVRRTICMSSKSEYLHMRRGFF